MTPNEHFVRGFLAELDKHAYPDKVKRTYTIEGLPDQLDKLEEAMSMMDWLGMAGASRTVQIHYDGDGRARMRFTRKGGKMKKSTDPDHSADKDTISFGID